MQFSRRQIAKLEATVYGERKQIDAVIVDMMGRLATLSEDSQRSALVMFIAAWSARMTAGEETRANRLLESINADLPPSITLYCKAFRENIPELLEQAKGRRSN